MKLVPMVTCICPCFNHQDFVADALKSIVAQSYDFIRIVFCDDGSTDNSFEVAKSLCSNLNAQPVDCDEPAELWNGLIENVPIILAKFKENHGVSVCRNYCINMGLTDTDLFAFLDCDDLMEPDKILKSVEVFQKYGDLIGIVYSDWTSLNHQTNELTRFWGQPYSREALLNSCIINMDSIYNKKVFEKVGGFDENLRVSEDWDMHLRATEHFIAIHLPESLLKIRINNVKNTTNKYSTEFWNAQRTRVFNKLNARLNLNV